jgi:putative glutamine amidotransferase
MSTRKPIIGVTSNCEHITALSNNADEFLFIRANYLNVIIDNGGIPVVLNNQIDLADVEQLVSRLDGLLLIGGQDVDSKCYGETCQINYCKKVVGSGTEFHRSIRDQPNYTRDLFEIELYRAAKKAKISVLGICRGYQLMNVAEGGCLYQEIPASNVQHNILADESVPVHKVNLVAGSLASQIFKSEQIVTCSIHHQGVRNLGNDFIASGFAEDGLIEMIEYKDKEHFIFGIQGHPERARKKHKENNLLFEAFIQSCK